MLPSNLWISKELKDKLEGVFKRRKLDLIPAICGGVEGLCVVSVSSEEMGHALSSISREVVIDATGTMTAQLIGTTIVVDVASVSVQE